MLRQYWQPVALSEELPPDGSPLPVRVLSEDLVLFRDDEGQLGLIGLHCSHRRADLSYGRVENGGLRCLYHGWLYDRHGNCLEQPCEPEGKKFCQKVRHPAYPCQERAGIIFAYMGPGEPPLFPPMSPLSPRQATCWSQRSITSAIIFRPTKAIWTRAMFRFFIGKTTFRRT